MAININADTTNGLVITSDNSGELKLQSAGADIATVSSTGLEMASGKNLYPRVPAFSVKLSADQAITNATFTKIAFDAVDFDNTSSYDNTTNYRFTPTVEGYYLFNIHMYSNAPDRLLLGLYKNGSTVNWVSDINNTSMGFTRTGGSALVYANGSTDYFEAYGYLDNTAATSFRQNSGSYFDGHLVSV